MPAQDPNLYPKSSMEEWNFRSWHVAVDQGGKNTNIITAESCLIAAGPARLTQIGDDFANKVVPIGMIESASFSQQKMVQQVREIGSRRSYCVSSYATGSITLSRVMYSQSSLLRVLTMANDDWTGPDGQVDIDNPAGSPSGTFFQNGNYAATTNESVWYANMQSEIFDRPMGLLIYMLDQRNVPYGAMYAEECCIQTHNFALAAQGVAISEQVSMVFDRLMPVSVSA